MSPTILPTTPAAPGHLAATGQLQPIAPVTALAEQPDPPALRWAVTPGTVLTALRRRWLLALSIGLATAAVCATAVWMLRPDKYTAVSLVRVASSEQKILQGQMSSGRAESVVYTKTQITLLRSRPVIQAALKDERVRQLPLLQRHPDPVEWLEKELVVEQVPDTEIVRISLTMRGAGTDLAAVVNAVVRAYLAEVVRGEQAAQEVHLNGLQTAYQTAEEKLRRLRDSFQSLTRMLKGGDSKILTLKQQTLLDEYSSLRRELAALNARLRDLAVKIAGCRLATETAVVRVRLPFRNGPIVPLPCPELARDRADLLVEHELDNDPQVKRLDAQAAKLRDQLSQFEAVAADPKSPFKADLQKRLEAAEAAARAARAERRATVAAVHRAAGHAAAARLLRECETERVAIEKQRDVLAEEAAARKTELDRFGIDSVDLELKRGEIERSELFLKAIWEQKERLEVELKGAARQRVSVVSEAEEATVLNKKGRAVEAGGVGFAGLAAALLAVAVFDLRRNRIHVTADVSRGLRLNVLGALPPLPGAATGVARSEGNNGFGEAIAGLRTTLLTGPRAGAGRGGLVVLVASAVAGEGKTTLATQLAASFARSRRRTLLIDCDLRSPSIHRLFGLPPAPGVCEVLTGGVEVADAVRATGNENLELLSGGNLDPAAEAALAQHAAVRHLLDTLRDRYDAVIIDSSPVLLVPDALMLGACVDGVLLSVRPGVSEAGEVYAGYTRLIGHRVPFLGAVVNGVALRATYARGYASRPAPAPTA